MMYESVDVVGLNPSPNPFLMMDYYNQSRGCLIPEKGLVSGAPHPYSTSIRNQHWNGSNHCRCPLLPPKPPRPVCVCVFISQIYIVVSILSPFLGDQIALIWLFISLSPVSVI